LDSEYLSRLFSLEGQVAVVTGGSGVLCSAIAAAYAHAGAKVAILNRSAEKGERVAEAIRSAGGEAVALACDVTLAASVNEAHNAVLERWGRVDILLNGAGGNKPEATSNPKQRFFDIPPEALRWVVDLNLLGTVIPCQIFGETLSQRGRGVILNVTSMSGFRPLTRVLGYSSAKAAVINFTQWLAVHLAQEYSPNLRVNALAPGFFLTEQNRFLLTEEKSGTLTARGKAIIGHTPMGRFGAPEDLIGTALWLVSPASAFVTGVVVPVDGGFNAFSGV
jgi:NAD(P)-dependent dehydrogenase (short-subunit alcohol dehydrogenase family)